MYYENLKDIPSGKQMTETGDFTSFLYVLQTKRMRASENREKKKNSQTEYRNAYSQNINLHFNCSTHSMPITYWSAWAHGFSSSHRIFSLGRSCRYKIWFNSLILFLRIYNSCRLRQYWKSDRDAILFTLQHIWIMQPNHSDQFHLFNSCEDWRSNLNPIRGIRLQKIMHPRASWIM